MKFCIEIDGVAVGGIGVHPGEDVHRHTATMGYWLGEEFWGRGVMTEAVTAVTDFCFENFPLRRISAEVFANNPASARVLEKAGFTFEGRLKNTSSKTESFSIHCSTAGRSSVVRARRLACLLITGDMARLIKPMISFIVPAYNEEHELAAYAGRDSCWPLWRDTAVRNHRR